MNVVISPGRFAGTLTAVQAATAIAEGWASVRPGDRLISTPLADGGEGTVAVLAHVRPDAVRHTVEVADARGLATKAEWVSLADGTAVVETAQACGLSVPSQAVPSQSVHSQSVLPRADSDPLRTTTYGVGQLLRAALDSNPSRVVVGVGGSATVDGGAGMAAFLTGHGLRRADGNAVKVGGRWVAEIVRVRPVVGADTLPAVVIASEVTNPLLGPAGSAAVFGPLSGADADQIAELESALASFAAVVERDLDGGPWQDLPGAGAAGGLGFALMAFLGGQVRSGAEVIAEMIGLEATGADVVITGEGSMDAPTPAGGGPAEVRRLGAEAGARTVALAGLFQGDVAGVFDIAESLGPDGATHPHEALVAAAARAARRLS